MVGFERILADNAKQHNVLICLFLKDFLQKIGLMRSQNLAPPKGQVGGSNPPWDVCEINGLMANIFSGSSIFSFRYNQISWYAQNTFLFAILITWLLTFDL